MNPQYASYAFYTEVYQGDKIPEQDWAQASKEACAYIDNLTYGRLKQGWDITDSVKNAVCSIAETVYLYNNADSMQNVGVESESVSGRSIRYTGVSEYQQQKQAQMKKAAGLYLPLSDSLRYAGV